MNFTRHFINRVIERVQELDELGGPDSLQEYILVLEEVKKEIENRIENAKSNINSEVIK